MNRRLIWQLASRYLRGKGSANVVPVLSRISMVAIAVSSAAMVVVFSIYNGMEGYVRQLYSGFYPEIKISAEKGKFFYADRATIGKIKAVQGVKAITTVAEDNVMVNNERTGEQKVILLKGIDANYLRVNNIRQYISGEDSVSVGAVGEPHTAIAGQKILNELGADIDNIFSTIQVFYANPDNKNFAASPEDALTTLELHPAGAFAISDEYDDKYLLAPLPLVQQLFHADGRCTSIELKVAQGRDEEVKAALKTALGAAFRVETRYEQNKSMFLVLKLEKWAIYVILSLVMLIASFNMIGALSVLVMEKQKDVAILRAMGAQSGDVRTIFLLEGIMWSLVGGVSGCLLGLVLSLLQQHYGFITLSGAFLMDAYPVQIYLPDILLVLSTVAVVGLLAAWYPARRAVLITAPTLKGA